MKAVLISQDKKLVLSEVPEPEIREGYVVIDVRAAGINRADLLQVDGSYPPPPGWPDWPGLECSGTVYASPGSSRFRPGDKVCALLGGGGYAEKVAVPEEMVMTVPRSMDSQTSDDETPTDVTDVPTGTSSTDVTEDASDTTDVPDSTETTDGESSQETDTVSEESSEPQAEQVVINTGNLVFTLLVGDRLYTAKADYLSSQTPLYAQQTENGWIYSFFIPSSFQEEVSLFLAGGSLNDCSVTLAVQNTLVDCTRFQIFIDKI